MADAEMRLEFLARERSVEDECRLWPDGEDGELLPGRPVRRVDRLVERLLGCPPENSRMT